MSYPSFPYIQTSEFQHRVTFEVYQISTDSDTGIESKALSESLIRFFSYPPSRGLSAGDETEQTRELPGLLSREFTRDIVLKWPPALVTALMDDSKEVLAIIGGEKYSVTDYVNPEGKSVYLSLTLKAVRYHKQSA